MESLAILSSTLAIRGDPAGLASGMLGPLFINPSTNDLFAMTASQVVAKAKAILAQTPEGNWRTISVGPPRISSSNGRVAHVDELIALVPLITNARIERAPLALPGRSARAGAYPVQSSLWPLLDSDAVIISHKGPRTGRIVSVDSVFEMPHPASGHPVMFERAIEIYAGDGPAIVAAGDAGALVTTARGAWIGIVVAAGYGRVFAAPLAGKMARERLEIPADHRIDVHNGRLKKGMKLLEMMQLYESEQRPRVNWPELRSRPPVNPNPNVRAVPLALVDELLGAEVRADAA